MPYSRTIRQSVVKKQVKRLRFECRRIQEALDAGDPQKLYAAFERAQHLAFDGKEYIAEGTPPEDEWDGTT